MKHKRNTGVIILVASLLFVVIFMDLWMVFSQTRQQTKESGSYQLGMISGELEATVKNAENLTMEIAIAAREYTDSNEALTRFIKKKKQEIIAGETGAFNVFIAGKDFAIIPDFDMPEDFVATERVWYTGAVKNQGRTYVSPPYQDAMTGDICYSVSVMMGDGDTVLGIDYTMENIQSHIAQMYDTGSHNAVIVTNEGIIAGCSEEGLIGKKLVSVLPDYAGIWSLAKNTKGVATAKIKADLLYENLFATKSGNGWYLIVSESDWELYKSSYIQLIVTVLLSIALFSVVIILYMIAVKNQKQAEKALASKEDFLRGITGELGTPIARILESSGRENIENINDYSVEMARIHVAGEKLSEMIGQIISYSGIVQTESREKEQGKKKKSRGMNKRFRTIILAFMILVMLISLYTNVSATYKWGNVLMQKQAEKYEFELSEWINTQKSILDMFVSTISTNPEMLDDYQGTVDYLNRITLQYPEISVSYMTNPKLEHTVYMNNGWEPDPDWHVEERQWYVDLMASEEDWLISAPYYDEQTGGYCVTFAEKVYDHSTGKFLGNFGIDFFMDKLVDILGDSYSDQGYAFLVDTEGDIINHPYGSYQMSQDGKTNVSALAYGAAKADGESTQIIRDYDGTRKILTAIRNDASKFSVYVVSGVWTIYGKVLVYSLLCLAAFLVCIILVYRLLTGLMRFQDETNRQMKEAADTAIAAGRAKSRFLAQMSHEIRTPINAVLGMNEMIIRETESSEIREYALNIQSAGRTLLSLINSILDFSKIEDGKMELVPVKYDVSSMINDLVNSISERAKNKGLEFVLHVEPMIPCELFGDDVRIRQVIMNLLTNAVKYTEKGKVTLVITGEKIRDKKFVLKVSVRDTGIGIKREDREKLFESFTRLDETRNRNIEGTGLGMSIVTKLLALMGSELKVESEYEKGSDFSFELTQEIVNEEPIGDFTERLRKSMGESGDERYLFTHEAKILVVDDNDTNRKVARSLMKRNGIIPDEASSGEETIEKMKTKQYDIVFLDHMMPKMDGVETLKRLKEEDLIPQGCVVIALTANVVSGARERYLDSGFDDYLSKPIEVAQLERKLAAHLPGEKVEWRTLKVSDENKETTRELKSKELSLSDEKTDTSEEILEFDAYPDDSKEIYEFEPDEESYENEDDDKKIIDKLKEGLGIDTEAALAFCAGEFALYEEILNDYVKACKDRKEELDACYKNADWHGFEVKVHALKSTSKTIGAIELAEKALSLEEAAGRKDAEFIRNAYSEFILEYLEMVQSIKEIIEA